MLKLIFFLFLLLLMINGMLVWKGCNKEMAGDAVASQLACKIRFSGNESSTFILPGALVVIK